MTNQDIHNDGRFHEDPDHTQREMRKMAIWLAGFFITLIGVVALVLMNAHSIARALPFAAEERFVKPYENLLVSQFGEPTRPEVDAYLQALTEELAAAMDMPEDYRLKVHYIDDSTVNAFATLAGHIFVFRGLIEETPDENSLAMVLAHEAAHIKHRDPAASLGRGLALSMLYGFITSDYSSSMDLAQLGGEAGLTFFSREQEQAADIVALSALNGHYGHVAGHDTFFAQIAEDAPDEEKWLEWLSTHPNLDRRLAYLRDTAAEKGFQKRAPQAIPSAILDAVKADTETPGEDAQESEEAETDKTDAAREDVRP